MNHNILKSMLTLLYVSQMAIGWWNLVFCYVNFEDRIDSHGYNYGLRPVFTLKPGIKITGGNGTSDSPYTLGT